jgi:hypothetical protein
MLYLPATSEIDHARPEKHAREVSRPASAIQRCCCGHVTRTVEEMRQHVAQENRPLNPIDKRPTGRAVRAKAYVADSWGSRAPEAPTMTREPAPSVTC